MKKVVCVIVILAICIGGIALAKVFNNNRYEEVRELKNITERNLNSLEKLLGEIDKLKSEIDLRNDEELFIDFQDHIIMICDPTNELNDRECRNKQDDLNSIIAEIQMESIISSNNETTIYLGDGKHILITNDSKKQLKSPAQKSIDVDWKKEMKGEFVVFSSDCRHKEGEHNGMRYKIIMSEVTNGIYVFVLEKKYPWYSYLEL